MTVWGLVGGLSNSRRVITLLRCRGGCLVVDVEGDGRLIVGDVNRAALEQSGKKSPVLADTP